jgi:hypothetical protein
LVSIDAETVSGRPDDPERWRACLCDGQGRILGGGVVVVGGAVRTCAHVVTQAGAPSVGTRVLSGCWAPTLDDGGADIALLCMTAAGVPELCGASLRGLRCPRNRHVRAFGFPHPHDYGIYGGAVLSGCAGRGGESIQLDLPPQGEHVRRGFSGSGVVDNRTDAVVGMVVTAYRDDHSQQLAWMVPIDSVVEHVPAVGQWLGPDVPCERWKLSIGSMAIVIDRRDQVGTGTVKVAAAGKSTDEVARVLHRDSLPLPPTARMRAPSAAESVGVAGIEEAREPEHVLDNVVGPLVRGARVVLQFSDADSPSARAARRRQRDALHARLDALAEGIAELSDREQRGRERIRARAVPPPALPEFPAFTGGLQRPLSVLRSGGADQDPARLQRAMTRCERRLAHSLDALAACWPATTPRPWSTA